MAISICVGLPIPAAATEDNPGVWFTFSTTDTFQTDDGASRWRYWFDAQARYFDLGNGTDQYLVRPAIGYDINKNLTAWAGYARFHSRSQSGNSTYEDRYWQQLNWTAGRWNSGTFSMRARLEQRSVSTGDDVGLVLRFQTKYVRPIGNSNNRTLILNIEPFVDLKDTDWGGESGPGQNRTFIGMGWRASDNVTIEAGYMNQYIWVDRGEDRVNHLGVLSFKVKL